MLQIVINGIFYKNDGVKFTPKIKKTLVFFYDYSDEVGYIIKHLKEDEMEKLRFNLYQKFHDHIIFTNFSEYDIHNGIFEGVKISSDIIDVPMSDFAKCLDRKTRKRYFEYDEIKEKYTLYSDFINFIRLGYGV